MSRTYEEHCMLRAQMERDLQDKKNGIVRTKPSYCTECYGIGRTRIFVAGKFTTKECTVCGGAGLKDASAPRT